MPLTIKQQNILTLAVEHARRLNNRIDCDVIENGCRKVEQAETIPELQQSLDYLACAVNYRKADKQSENFALDFAKQTELRCPTCKCVITFPAKDGTCGYHNQD